MHVQPLFTHFYEETMPSSALLISSHETTAKLVHELFDSHVKRKGSICDFVVAQGLGQGIGK